MNQPAAANLIIDKCFRGHLPVADLALSDSGEVMIAIPDEYRARVYHVISIAPECEPKEIGFFSMEKPSKTASSADGRFLVAATDDKIYTFVDGIKSRLFADRRNAYTDISVCSSGEYFVVSGADMMASDHTVTLARTSGSEVWTKSLPFSITAARISSDGGRILVGSEEGKAMLLDSSRRILWQMEEIEPITTGAISTSGELSAFLTKTGSVVAISGDGERLWHLEGVGYGKACAIAAQGGMIAAANLCPDLTDRLSLYSPDGNPLFAHDPRQGIRSIACSPNGRFVAISCEDGTLQVLEIVVSTCEKSDAEKAKGILDEACSLAEGDDRVMALEKLREALELAPAEVDACRRYVEIRDACVGEMLFDSDKAEASGDLCAAYEALESAWDLNRFNEVLFGRITSLRNRLIESLFADAESLSDAGRLEEAIVSLQKILKLDMANYAARHELGRLEQSLTDSCVREARSLADDGHPGQAVAMLEKAYSRRPTMEIHQELLKVQAAQALFEGLQAYEEKMYARAILLFKKVLSIDPDNSEASRYMEYSRNIGRDDALSSRFSKLE